MAHLDLIFRASLDPKEPHSPIAHIYVKECTHDYKGHGDTILVSPECVTLREVEESIDSLSQDLEAIRKKARAKFKR